MASPKEGRQHTAEYDALTEMTGDLCNALPIDDLLPKMISKRVIDFHDKNEIRSERTDRDKVDLFISKLMKEMSSRENKRFYKFIEAMKESPKCDFLVRRMEEWINHFQKGTPPPIQTGNVNTLINPSLASIGVGNSYVNLRYKRCNQHVLCVAINYSNHA